VAPVIKTRIEHPQKLKNTNVDANSLSAKTFSYPGMKTNSDQAVEVKQNALGEYLKLCRARLRPADLGIHASRRRTPGLRREELAQRAALSVTWYTWLEQGRGGKPSREALSRVADALLLTPVERQHLFALAFGPSEGSTVDGCTAEDLTRLQRVVDAFTAGPAYIKTSSWDLLVWNSPANAVFGYDQLASADVLAGRDQDARGRLGERGQFRCVYFSQRVRTVSRSVSDAGACFGTLPRQF
jgi:transcriptional regulator with XRE-family HTH domain